MDNPSRPEVLDDDELEPNCETAGSLLHRHTAHCFGVDGPDNNL